MRYKTSKEPLEKISLRISAKEREIIYEIAKDNNMTFTEVLRSAIQELVSPYLEMEE